MTGLELGQLPLLSLLIGTPLLGAVLVWGCADGTGARRVALAAALGELLLAGAVGLAGAGAAEFRLLEQAAWMPSLHIHYRVGVDGLSALFPLLTALLFTGVVASARPAAKRPLPRLYFSLLLMLEGVTVGIFCALDTILLFLFWELTLIPSYFLVSLWGIGPNRRQAAAKYTLLMMAGGVPLLLGLLLPALHGSPPQFDLGELLRQPLPLELQRTVFLLLLAGFGVKVPLVPFHAWLPTLAMEGPVAVAAIMTGLKLGAYGLLRFAIPLAPDAARELHWLLAGLGVAGILYGALLALVQTNLRRLLAYASISHVGLVVLGLATFTLQGVQGAVLQLLNFALVSGGIFLLTGFIHQRLGSTELIHLGGLARPMPRAAGLFLLLGLAGMGMPLTAGFPAEHLLLIGVLQSHAGAGLAALGGMILGAAYFLGIYRRAFFGPVGNQAVAGCPDLLQRELLVLAPAALLILALGCYPALLTTYTQAAANAWLGR